MTLEEISLIVFDQSNAGMILDRILDFSVVPEGEPVFMLDEDESKSFYGRIIINSKLILPTEERINEEVAEYKAELTVIENARLTEAARIEDIRSRFDAISDIRGTIAKSGIEISNPAIELKRIIKENDQTRLALLESSSADFQSEQALKAAKDQANTMADGLVNLCLGCVKIVMKHNIANGLTKEQKDQQAIDYSDVFDALKEWRPGKFKSAVLVISPDGLLVTDALRLELLSFLSDNGL